MGTFHVSLDIGGPAGDRYESRIVSFGDEDSEPLVGAATMEGFGLAVDPINRRLVPIERFPMAAMCLHRTRNFAAGETLCGRR